MIQIYGQFEDGTNSFAHVARQLVFAMNTAHLEGQMFYANSLNPCPMDLPWPQELRPNDPIGIYVGYPPGSVAYLEGHDHRFIFTVCETDRIPEAWVAACNTMDAVIVPSRFCAGVFKAAGVKVPIWVVPHGVESWFTAMAKPFQEDEPRVLQLVHVTAALSFAHRKGTPNLVTAFQRWRNPLVQLTIKLPISSPKFEALLGEGVTVDTTRRDRISYATWLQGFDACVQPSAGEGFGMVPLEAKCLGVPVIATAHSGHDMYIDPETDCIVDAEHIRPLPTQGNPYGEAPIAGVDEIVEALDAFVGNRRRYQSQALDWRAKRAARWSWPNVLAPFVIRLKNLVHEIRSDASARQELE